MNLLTPPGLAGIAVLRAAPGERSRLMSMLKGRAGCQPRLTAGAPPRQATLHCGALPIDDVLVVDRGALGVELHVHGSPAVIDALRGVFALTDAVPGSPAERLLWHAMARGQLELAIEQLPLDFDAFLRELETLPQPRRRERCAEALRRTRTALAHVEPPRVLLVGAQNAGKSSLFNALLLRERVLAGPQPGLTRDPVAEIAMLAGYPYELIDAAGEGPTTSPVDARALAMARSARKDALTVLVVDGAVGPTRVDRVLAQEATLVIANKSDLAVVSWPEDLPRHLLVSCHTDEPGRIRRDVGRLLRERRGLPPAGPVGGVAALSRDDARRLEEHAARLAP